MTATKEVESEVGLRHHFMPQVEGKVGVGGADAGHKVVLVSLDGTFGDVGTVHALGSGLEADGFGIKKIYKSLAAFIVEAVQLGTQARFD